MSIKPKYCELISSGKKTVEVRKTKPKLETPFKCYIYCTASNVHECLMVNENGAKLIYASNYKTAIPFGGRIANGKVVGEFVCDEIYTINKDSFGWFYGTDHDAIGIGYAEDIEELWHGIPESELIQYLAGRVGYAWHISDLVIYDRPKELSEFIRICPEWRKEKITDRCLDCEHLYTSPIDQFLECDYEGEVPITRPPQSWCYVEELRCEGG